MKKIIAISTISFIILLVIILFFLPSILSNPQAPNNRTPLPNITPFILSSSPIPDAPESTLLLPTNPPSEGGGVNTSAPTVQTSTSEIRKVYPLLPYTQQLTLSTGLTVDVFVSDTNMNSRPWVLPISIEGIDYNASEGTPEYTQSRASFREAALKTLEWLKQQGVDTSKIFVSWGDRAYIQDKAEEWLQ
ncbi:MAG: hypothetical protein KA035_03415 [Candidatus Levybacteria bacterium]|nr:hypothetical protein [Candidatus Levybacteria bacterium]